MKFFDLGLADPATRAAMDAAYGRVMDSGWMILGPELAAFEAEFAAYCGAGQAVGVGNGLDALVLALRAAGVGAGDEVIVPAHTFTATWLAVEAVGARPVPVEVDPDLYVLTAPAVAAAITPRTRAVIPVSLYGHPVDLDPILDLAGRHGLFVLEDAAQSHGARLRGRRTGAAAHATAFSFYPTKNLGALGDGGAIVTNRRAVATRLRRLRDGGRRGGQVSYETGINSRLDEMQCCYLRAFLPHLAEWNAHRRRIAAIYDEMLADCRGVRLLKRSADSVCHLYVLRAKRRTRLREFLAKAGIGTGIHYPVPLHLHPAFADAGQKRGSLPHAEKACAEIVSLPLWPYLPESGAREVAEQIRAFYAG